MLIASTDSQEPVLDMSSELSNQRYHVGSYKIFTKWEVDAELAGFLFCCSVIMVVSQSAVKHLQYTTVNNCLWLVAAMLGHTEVLLSSVTLESIVPECLLP